MLLTLEQAVNDEFSGNKARQLGRLTQAGFRVPSAFVLNSLTYQQLIEKARLKDTIRKLLENLTAENLAQTSRQLQQLFDQSLSAEIQTQLEDQIDPKKKYAIRSSALKEDLAHYSFAGQYESFLNVATAEKIAQKVVACYRSLFEPNVLLYLLHHQLPLEDLQMAVIIQEMVAADFSGVSFTLNPLTGADQEMVLELTQGLGETLVAGHRRPEEYHWHWGQQKITLRPQQTHFNDDEIISMGRYFLAVARFFGYPCDIEFAYMNDTLYLLQVRQITKIAYSGLQDRWTTANFKDSGVSAKTYPPFMWSLYESVWDSSLRHYILAAKILPEKALQRPLGARFYGRVYWNLSVVKEAMSQVIGYRERDFDEELGIKINYSGPGQTKGFSMVALSKLLRMGWLQQKIVNEQLTTAPQLKDDLLADYKDYTEQLSSFSTEKWRELIQIAYPKSEETYFRQVFINTVQQAIFKAQLLKYVSQADYLHLIGNLENISHLRLYDALWELSRKIRQEPAVRSFWLNQPAKELFEQLKKEGSAFSQEFWQIVHDFGYHSAYELDVTYPSYAEEPLGLLISLQSAVALTDDHSPAIARKQAQENYQKVLAKLRAQVSKRKFQRLERKVLRMRRLLWWREEFKDISTRYYDLIRQYNRILGEELTAQKILPAKEKIGFLQTTEIIAYLNEQLTASQLTDRYRQNESYYQVYRNYYSENDIGPEVVTDALAVTDTADLQGVGANSGIVKGRARVVTDFKEIGSLSAGDILVTQHTDTGWTPVFGILGGLITERGGILCHAAIVAREYDLPAIVSCPEAVAKIRDGDQLLMDGKTGKIRIE